MDENVPSNHDQDDGAFAYSSYSIMCPRKAGVSDGSQAGY